MDEQLIELVRCHEELYNSTDKKFSDIAHKQMLWKEFAEQLHKSPEYCKNRWESLRSQFRKVCRFRKTKAGQAAGKIKRWKYEAELSFLLPYMKGKRSLATNVGDMNDDPFDKPGEDEPIIKKENTSTASISQNAAPIFLHAFNSPSIPSVSSVGTTLQQQTRIRARTSEKKYPSVVPQTADSTLMQYVIDQKKAEQESQKRDPLDYFFDSVKETVKTFSPADKHLAKTKIFHMVSEIEAKYLNLENNP